MRTLTNPHATPEALRLFRYIQSLQGKRCLTGQMESGWRHTFEGEMGFIREKTGCLPAIRGLDFIHNDFDGVANRAIDWHNRGGIVTICWHTGPDFASSYRESQENDLNWESALIPGTAEHETLLAAMDRAVPALRRLQAEKVPVLWRPFHEFDGKWFWWGRGGEEGFIALWRLMYDRYVNLHQLHNLIWVLGFSDAPGDLAPWYPGHDVVDILGGDSYKGGAQGELYRKCAAIAPQGMPTCYHENGEIPTSAQMAEENAPWVWFMTWHTKWIMSDEFNTAEKLQTVFHDPHFVTLEELQARPY